ncbi:MAG: hypothetical protein ACOC4I_01730 [Spirochaetota bacterium]
MAHSDTQLTQDIEELINGMGMNLVSMNQQVVNGRLHVSLVVHKPGGVKLDDCADVHRTVQPRISVLTGRRDLSIEVSSPGIGRKLKEPGEYRPFIGSMIKVLPRDGDWFSARLRACDDTTVELERDGTVSRMSYDTITVSRLDDTV